MAANRKKQSSSRRKGMIVLCVILILILAVLLIALAKINAYEKQTAANVYGRLTLEAGSPVPTQDNLLVTPDGNPVTITKNLTAEEANLPGTYTVLFTWRDREFSTVVQVADTQKPTGTAKDLTIMGPVPKAADFVENIQDVTDVTVSYKEEPDMTHAGVQPITLVLTDTSGNSTELTANATVVVDTQAPVISGVRNITVYQGGTAAYRTGIEVTDDLDTAPVLTVDSASVDLNQIGKYTIVYTATDLSGNTTQKKATVEVCEKQPNVVELDVIEAAADKLIAKIINSGMDQRQQVEAIYKWARSSCSYSNHSDKSSYLQGAYQMLTTKAGDCFNYYAVTKLLFDRLGILNIDVRKVKNHDSDSDHYWSLVSLDNGETWYHFDATPRVGAGDDFCLVTDAFLDAYSKAHDNCHNRDTTLYPATPEN